MATGGALPLRGLKIADMCVVTNLKFNFQYLLHTYIFFAEILILEYYISENPPKWGKKA